MSDAVIGWNPVPQPVGTLVGGRLNVRPLSSLGAGVCTVRSSARAKAVAGLWARASRPGHLGAYAGRSASEITQTSICKSLQAWLAPRAITRLGICKAGATDVTTLFFMALCTARKVTQGLGLAHHLHYHFAHRHGNFSSGLVQFGADGGSSAQPKGFQSPRARDCACALRVDQASARCGVAFPRFRDWRYATPAGVARVKAASKRSRENCAGSTSVETR